MTRARLLGGLCLAASLVAPAALAQAPTPPGAITSTPLAPLPGGNGQPLVAPTTPAQAPAAPGQPTQPLPSDTGAVSGAPTAPVSPTAPPAPSAPPAPGAPAAAPAPTTPGTPAPGVPADTTAPQTYTPAPVIPEAWQPEPTAELQVLDKINAQSSDLTVRVGSSVQYRSLTIAVRACDASTKDEKGDATAFLDITDSHPDEPSFHGWMLKSDPSISMLQHPLYDVRVLACHA